MLHLNKYIINKKYIQYKNHIFNKGDRMKLFFQIIALSTIIISVYLNTHNLFIVKKEDKILNEIIKYASDNDQDEIESEIIDNTILVGKTERKVNIKKSYINMSIMGGFYEEFIVYDEEYKDFENFIEYKIIGSKTDDKEISIIILLNNNDNKFNISNISYFADGYWYERNKISVDGITGYNFDYHNYNLPWLIYEIKKYNKMSFCLYEDCSMYGLYTIDGNIIYNNFLKEIKENLKPGVIFILDYNDDLINEINIIVNYVKNKGYQIKKIENLLNRY